MDGGECVGERGRVEEEGWKVELVVGEGVVSLVVVILTNEHEKRNALENSHDFTLPSKSTTHTG